MDFQLMIFFNLTMSLAEHNPIVGWKHMCNKFYVSHDKLCYDT